MKVEYLEKMKDFYSKLPLEQQAEGLSLLLDEIIREKKEKAECGNKKWNKKSSKKLISGSTTHTNPEEKTRTEEKTKTKQNPTESDLKAKENPKVISDTEQEYGNPEINLLIDLIKSFNGGIIDGTIKEQRQYGYLLLQKLKKLPTVESGKFKRNEVLETILRIISQNKYHSSKLVSTEKIFRNLTLLMQECKKEFQKAEAENLVITTI